MPCNLGYRSVARAKVSAPEPQSFEARTAPPALDEELLTRLGQADPVFAEWLQGLDAGPLLEKALERALRSGAPVGLELAICGGRLAARGTVRSDAERRAAWLKSVAFGRRWQLEVLRVVAELLDFEVELSEDLVLEGEKAGAGGVHEYLRIRLDGRGDAELRFEHYKSQEELEAEEDRFEALAQKLGVRIVAAGRKRSGQAIPEGAVHPHSTKKRGKS